jgi:prepilin-type N-terminal cleavage/methylation domain-containing protein
MSERGFTMIELLVAVTLSLVVFGLVGTTLVAYQNDAQRSTRQNDSQDRARLAIDRIVSELRDAASSRAIPSLVEAAGPYDLVFQTIGSPPAGGSQNPTGLIRMRYCIPPDPAPGTAAREALFMQTQSWSGSSAPANPWAGGATACPSSGPPPTGSSISTTKLAAGVMNRFEGRDRPAFSYDSADLSQITTIGFDLFIDVDPDQAPDETELRSAAFLRNQNQAPVASFTATATGGGHVLLNGGGSSDPDNQQLTYEWFRMVGATPTPIGATGLLDWAPGAGSYEVRLTVTDSGGLATSVTETVEVS